jgi:BASS family bile acid:Na+ symporter
MAHSVLTTLARSLRNRNLILVLAVVLGLGVGERVAVETQPLVLPLLGLVMTLSILDVTSREFVSLKNVPRVIIASLLLNYVVMGGVILLMSRWLISDEELRTGFVVLAAVPPAVAVVPFSHMLGGDTKAAVLGMTGAYLAALAIMPAAMALFLGVEFFDPLQVLLILGELILAPIVVSRILLVTGLARRLLPWRGTIVNWSFFVTLFTIVGLNRQAFFGEFDILLRMGIIAVATTFLLAYSLELVTKALRTRHETTVNVILMGTLKNYSLAGGILLTLFSDRSAIPPSVCVVFGVLLLIWLGFHFRKHAPGSRPEISAPKG